MKFLIVGSKGMLGQDLMKVCSSLGEVTGCDIDELDITDAEACIQMVSHLKSDWIVNAAAFTAVDQCETDRDIAMKVNGEGAGNLARAAASSGSQLVHISTDYVFDGSSEKPYSENDAVNPQSIYGQSKLEGERQVVDLLPDAHMIVRTSWLFGVGGPNFVETILGVAGQGKALRVVDDQKGGPTYTWDLACAIGDLIGCQAKGIFHVSNTGATTWFRFAEYFLSKTYPEIRIEPVTTEAFPRPAKRPANSVFSHEKIARILGSEMPSWQDAVDRYLAEKHPELLKEIAI